jgi:cell division cycle protein 20 (cofactor of APC complex)
MKLSVTNGVFAQTIHFWNTTTSARLNSLVTNSQVTSILFNPHSKEFVSSHGLPDNQLSVWAFPSLAKIADITQAHDTRVLHSAISPDGCAVATASSDENLKCVGEPLPCQMLAHCALQILEHLRQAEPWQGAG